MRAMRILLSIIVLSLPVVATAEGQARHVAVDGIGTVSGAPDMAVVQFGVQREARDAASAMAAASAAMTDVLATLKDAGIAPEDIQTTRVGLDPRWRHAQDGSPPRVTGYVASNTLSVSVRDLDALGPVLDAVVSDGANMMHGLSFQIADASDMEDEARQLAVRDAARKASILAKAGGAQLGPVISIAEGSTGGAPIARFETALADRGTVPIAGGSVDVVVQVRAVFELTE